MIIRKAKNDDIFDLLVLARGFSREAPAMHKWDKDKTEAMLMACIEGTHTTILVMEHEDEVVGGIVGVVQPLFMSQTVVASELAWFVDPAHRGKGAIKLVKAFEGWAKEMQADYITMADIRGIADLSKLYQRLGYELTEAAYSKKVE